MGYVLSLVLEWKFVFESIFILFFLWLLLNSSLFSNQGVSFEQTIKLYDNDIRNPKNLTQISEENKKIMN